MNRLKTRLEAAAFVSLKLVRLREDMDKAEREELMKAESAAAAKKKMHEIREEASIKMQVRVQGLAPMIATPPGAYLTTHRPLQGLYTPLHQGVL